MKQLHPDLMQIIDAVKNRPATVTLETLSEKADVTLRWLQDFIAGKLKHPTYDRVARVRDTVAALSTKD